MVKIYVVPQGSCEEPICAGEKGLVLAVIQQAVKDYREAKAKAGNLEEEPEDQAQLLARCEMENALAFFDKKNPYWGFVELNPDYIREKLEVE